MRISGRRTKVIDIALRLSKLKIGNDQAILVAQLTIITLLGNESRDIIPTDDDLNFFKLFIS